MPSRTCVVCRENVEKKDLLRFVLVPHKSLGSGTAAVNMEVDHKQTQPGRGVYCHAKLECLSQAKFLPLAVRSLESTEKRLWYKKDRQNQEKRTSMSSIGSLFKSGIEKIKAKRHQGKALGAKEQEVLKMLTHLQQELNTAG